MYGGLVAYVATRQPPIAPLLATIGGIGAVLLVSALVWRWEDVLPWALVVLGIAYTVAIAAHSAEIDEAAPLVGAGLLLSSELATWSLDERWSIAAERAVTLSRATAIALLVLAGGAVSAIVVALAAAPVGGGLAWTILGAGAAVLVVALTVRLAR